MGCCLSSSRMLSGQRATFARAVECSKLKNKPLLIIGDPHNGCLNRCIPAYDVVNEGDRILDLNPSSNSYASYDLNHTHLQEFADDSYVIFESKTFNFSNNIETLLCEAMRVSGGDVFCTGSNTGYCWAACGRRAYSVFTQEGLPEFSLAAYWPGDNVFRLHYFETGTRIEMRVNEFINEALTSNI